MRFYPMNLLWLLGCSQDSEVRAIRAIWMKSSPTKAGTKASTSCHPCGTANVDSRIYTAPTEHSQPSGCLDTEINICSFILENEWRLFAGMLRFPSRTSPSSCFGVAMNMDSLKCRYLGTQIFNQRNLGQLHWNYFLQILTKLME